ncbi:MAG: ABC transporter permease [Firmicutes bacterium]|nr:ABC transporter permease [Bacillota bacterium]
MDTNLPPVGPVPPVGAGVPAEPESLSYIQSVWRRFRRHRLAMFGGALVLALVLFALAAPWILPYKFDDIDLAHRFSPPSATHWFGTDDLGHDELTRVIYGGRVSLLIGFASAISSAIIGMAIGAVAGYYGGLLDNVLMRFTDIMFAIPTLPLLFVLSRILGGSVLSIIVVLVLMGWMTAARLVRGSILSLKQREFIEASRAVGAGNARIIIRHLLPNALAPVVVASTLMMGSNIILESSLSYLGLGVMPPTPTWGNMLSNAQEAIWRAPWLAIYPGIFILVTVLGFNFLGDGLRDALDPKSKR